MKKNKIVFLSLFLFVAQCCYPAEQNKSPIIHDVYSQVPTEDYLEFQLFDNLEDDDISFFSLLEDSIDSDDEKNSFETEEVDENKMQIFLQDWDDDLSELLLNDYETEQTIEQSNPRKKNRINKNTLDDYTLAGAIGVVLRLNNMSIEKFNELSAYKKITLLLQVKEDDLSQLTQQEQEALDKLRVDREEMNRLDNERYKKRTFEQKLNNEREQFNKQYLHAIELIIDAGKIDRVSFHALESDKKLELLLNLTPEQLQRLPIEERQNLQKLQRKRGLPKKSEKIKRPKFNDLYTNVIEKVIEHNNMTIEDFNQLSGIRKTTLLLQLAEEDYSQLAQHEQEALHKLRKDREKYLKLKKDRYLNNQREKFNSQYLHAIELIIDAGKIDRVSFHALESDKKLELLLNLTPEQVQRLPIDEQQNLENLQQKHALQKKEGKWSELKFNNELYARAIEKVLEHNNMSIDAFNQLSGIRKTTLLLQLAREDYSQLAQHEQEALDKLRVDREEMNRLDNERHKKRTFEQKLNNEREQFNKQYLHAIELIIDAGKIDRASFNALESNKKLELLLNLTPEQVERLPINERQNLQLQQKINQLRKRQKSN